MQIVFEIKRATCVVARVKRRRPLLHNHRALHVLGAGRGMSPRFWNRIRVLFVKLKYICKVSGVCAVGAIDAGCDRGSTFLAV